MPPFDMCAMVSTALLTSVQEAFGLGVHEDCTQMQCPGCRRAEVAQVLVMERRAVAVHYLHTWFVLDLIASIPLDLLLRGRRLDILRLPRLLKIIRMMQNKSFSQAGEDPGPKTAEGARHHIGQIGCILSESCCTLAHLQRSKVMVSTEG